MSRRCSEYTAIKVDGKWYRAERYDYRSCSEVLIRGDFQRGVPSRWPPRVQEGAYRRSIGE